MRPSATSSRIRVAHLEDARGIEPVHRLVEDQQLGVGQQAAGDAEPLAHPERVRLDAVVAAGGEARASAPSIRVRASPPRAAA